VAFTRLSMRKLHEILRLKYEVGLSDRQNARVVGCSRTTVQNALERVRMAGLSWPLPAGLAEDALQARLYPGETRRMATPLPDFTALERALTHKGVTRLLLWEEYRAVHPDGYGYSAFCQHLAHWRRRRTPVLRLEHRPGEKLFVDYAGPTLDIIDRRSGEVRSAQIFVAVLGYSNYTFAEATFTQALPDWLGSHVRALNFIGGCPGAIVPDNLRSAVSRAHRYEPDLNPAYQDFAEHYGVAILPARVRKPRDKAKVEVGVQIVERWILARLRHQTFFSLAELNTEIARLLSELNARPFKKMEGSRRSRFEELERAALKPLPAQAYEYAQWKQAKVHPDYHIEVERAYYSVPYRYIGARVEVRVTASTLEIFHRGERIAAHIRAPRRGAFTTLAAHRPEPHRAVVEASHARLLERALAIGPATAELLRIQAQLKCHPEQALRSAQGILRLAADFSPARLETACTRALMLKAYSYRAVRALIMAPPPAPVPQASLPRVHTNLRGPDYYQ